MTSIISLVLTGNLTKDATFNIVNNERGVYNFTIAVNLKAKRLEDGTYEEKKPIFIQCAYYVKTKGEGKLLDYLKKGKNISVFANSLPYESKTEGNNVEYTNIKLVVKQIDL